MAWLSRTTTCPKPHLSKASRQCAARAPFIRRSIVSVHAAPRASPEPATRRPAQKATKLPQTLDVFERWWDPQAWGAVSRRSEVKPSQKQGATEALLFKPLQWRALKKEMNDWQIKKGTLVAMFGEEYGEEIPVDLRLEIDGQMVPVSQMGDSYRGKSDNKVSLKPDRAGGAKVPSYRQFIDKVDRKVLLGWRVEYPAAEGTPHMLVALLVTPTPEQAALLLEKPEGVAPGKGALGMAFTSETDEKTGVTVVEIHGNARSIVDSHGVKMPAGVYALLFGDKPAAGDPACQTFVQFEVEGVPELRGVATRARLHVRYDGHGRFLAICLDKVPKGVKDLIAAGMRPRRWRGGGTLPSGLPRVVLGLEPVA